MKQITLQTLNDLNACHPARDWVVIGLSKGKTPHQLWQECDRATWMTWLLFRLRLPRPQLARLLLRVVCETPLSGDGGLTVGDKLRDPRSHNALAVLERIALGEDVSDDEVTAAYRATCQVWYGGDAELAVSFAIRAMNTDDNLDAAGIASDAVIMAFQAALSIVAPERQCAIIRQLFPTWDDVLNALPVEAEAAVGGAA